MDLSEVEEEIMADSGDAEPLGAAVGDGDAETGEQEWDGEDGSESAGVPFAVREDVRVVLIERLRRGNIGMVPLGELGVERIRDLLMEDEILAYGENKVFAGIMDVRGSIFERVIAAFLAEMDDENRLMLDREAYADPSVSQEYLEPGMSWEKYDEDDLEEVTEAYLTAKLQEYFDALMSAQ